MRVRAGALERVLVISKGVETTGQVFLNVLGVLQANRHADQAWANACGLALRFGEGDDDAMSRPFGVALLLAGWDEAGGPGLFHADPSGTFTRYDAKAIGSGSEGALASAQRVCAALARGSASSRSTITRVQLRSAASARRRLAVRS